MDRTTHTHARTHTHTHTNTHTQNNSTIKQSPRSGGGEADRAGHVQQPHKAASPITGVGGGKKGASPLPASEDGNHGRRDESSPFIMGDVLSVVPAKLVKKIVRGDFVDIAELLRDNMEVERRRAGWEGEPSLTRRREVPDILSWLQCLAYQALIISKHRRCGGRGWLLYNAPFRQQVSNIRKADFSWLNQSLYLTTFVAYGVGARVAIIVCSQTTPKRSVPCAHQGWWWSVVGQKAKETTGGM